MRFTGGESTLHPDLPGLIAIARRLGLTVGLTSNGENGAAVLPAAAAAGLDRINLSVFGTTPAELAAVQAPRCASPKLAERKLAALDATIETAVTHGTKISANVVVPDRGHVDRVLRVIERHGRSVVVRMLASLDESALPLIAMGQGIQLPPDATRRLYPRHGVAYVDVTDLEPWTAALGRLPRRRDEPLVAALRQAAQRVLRRA
ncbi:hypothetical protein GCM10011428_06710 [Streptomyces violaceus]